MNYHPSGVDIVTELWYNRLTETEDNRMYKATEVESSMFAQARIAWVDAIKATIGAEDFDNLESKINSMIYTDFMQKMEDEIGIEQESTFTFNHHSNG